MSMKVFRHRQGFTLVELMIATTILSTVLVLTSAAITQINGIFFKGLASTRAQEAARSVIDDVSRELQLVTTNPIQGTFSDTSVNPNITYRVWCVGNSAYYMRMNVAGNDTTKILLKAPVGTCPADSAIKTAMDNLTSSTISQDFTAYNLSVQNFSLTSKTITINGVSKTAYDVQVTISYANIGDLTSAGSANAACKGGGVLLTKNCAVSKFSTTVTRLLQ